MTCKLKTSRAFEQKKARIRKLPKIGEEMMMGMRKKDAYDLIMIFHDGIKNDSFGLKRLMDLSIEHKKSMGYAKPTYPLYGKGDDDKKKSFMNMMRMRRLKNGWKIYPSWGRHHKANLELRHLLMIHEYGCLIKQKNGNIIRIPPRPAWLYAKNRFFRKLSASQEDKDRKSALTEYIQTGKSKYMDKALDILKKQYNDIVDK